MSISRVTTWSSGQVLTASALNGEFDNIINNALALVSPFTGNLNINGNVLQNISAGAVGSPGLYFNNDSVTGLYSSATNVVDITAGGVRGVSVITAATGVNYLKVTPAATGASPTVTGVGSDTDVGLNLAAQAAGAITISSANTAFIPAAVSGTPAQNALFRNNLVKAWISFDGTGTITIKESFNVTSITDNGTGDYTVTWDRDFSAGTYAVNVTSQQFTTATSASQVLAGSVRISTLNSADAAADADYVVCIAMGAH